MHCLPCWSLVSAGRTAHSLGGQHVPQHAPRSYVTWGSRQHCLQLQPDLQQLNWAADRCLHCTCSSSDVGHCFSNITSVCVCMFGKGGG
jgi:hypothetical protein